MSFSGFAGLGGIGFVLVAIAVNVVYLRARLPLPVSGQRLEEVTDAFAAVGRGLKRPSVLAPASWLCTTVFAAGLLSVLWRGGAGPGAWALVGFAGVLMQNAPSRAWRRCGSAWPRPPRTAATRWPVCGG